MSSMVHFIKGKLYARKIKDEKVICLLGNFRDRQINIVAHRGTVCNRKRSPRVHWILGRLHDKNQGPKYQEISNKKDISLLRKL